MRKSGLIILLLLLGHQVGWSQTEECVTRIKKWYDLLESKLTEVNKKNVFEMKFTMDLVYQNRGRLDSTSYKAHVVSDQEKKYFFGDDTRVYQNEKMTASVLLKNKEVHLFDTPPKEYNATVNQRYELFEDTLLSVVDYAQLVGRNQVKLFFKRDNPVAQGVKEIRFDFSGNQLVNTIQTIYYPDQRYASVKVTYETIKFNSKTKILDKKLKANIMHGNKLIPEYQNYTLYDHRKNK